MHTTYHIHSHKPVGRLECWKNVGNQTFRTLEVSLFIFSLKLQFYVELDRIGGKQTGVTMPAWAQKLTGKFSNAAIDDNR